MIIFLFLSHSVLVELLIVVVLVSTEANIASRFIASPDVFVDSIGVSLSFAVVSHIVFDPADGITSLASAFLGLRNGSTNDSLDFVVLATGSLGVVSPRTILRPSKGSSAVAVASDCAFSV